MSIYQEWIDAKATEAAAVKRRREIEDELIDLLRVNPALDGTENRELDGYAIKVTGRMNRKVDGDRLQEIAADHGLTDHLSSLFRWKPELDLRAWKAADESITAPLLGAITTTPGRPSFTITKES
jgi:hypothetical protein